MPVVINEFEVIPQEQAPPAQSATPTQQGQGSSSPAPTPHEVAQMLTKQVERLERVRAY